jgi:hypothetical protein
MILCPERDSSADEIIHQINAMDTAFCSSLFDKGSLDMYIYIYIYQAQVTWSYLHGMRGNAGAQSSARQQNNATAAVP